MRKSIFVYSSYKDFIKDCLSDRMIRDRPVRSIAQLARFCGVQRTYVSRILNQKSNFSEDQIFMAAKYFELGEDETEFLQLLASIERTKLSDRREILIRQIELVRKRKVLSDPNESIDQPLQTKWANTDDP